MSETPRDQQRPQNRLDPLAAPPPAAPESLVYGEDERPPDVPVAAPGDQRPADEPLPDDQP